MRIFGMITTSASAEYTNHALGSFFAHTRLADNDLFYLIDNDGDFSLPPELRFSQLRKVVNPEPLGFSENMNKVLSHALTYKADAVLLNNDLLFTPGWFDPVKRKDAIITSPLTNRELSYNLSNFQTSVRMTLDDVRGKEMLLNALAENHSIKLKGYHRVMSLPFAAVNIPHAVIAGVGLLDTDYGIGGGEDYDYCLRAHLAGYSVEFARGSYIIHFGGKSSWDGVEAPSEQLIRERRFFATFEKKWGNDLLEIILKENHSIVHSNEILSQLADSGQYREVIEKLR